MKKILTAIAIALFLIPSAKADEGMWLLPLLEQMNSDALRNLGARLTPEQIYSINNSSIKDAVVQFGGGCTGEIISDKGLLVTNHHCGYSSIQSLSTTEHNWLEDGYWAMTPAEELPVPGLTVRFLQSMTDVTERTMDQQGLVEVVDEAKRLNPGCSITVTSFFNDNYRYLIVSKIYRDVRFVGAPPASAGKFGGDTDNWMWPRHTCDFSMFRVYAGPDNEPADYSPENVPMRPRQSLKVSLRGVKEGDFAMIMGYPGSTQRFQTASQLESMLDVNDVRIAARTVRQDVLWKAMRADEKVGLQYASKYSSSSNGWKKWQGMREAFAKLDVIGRERLKEQEFSAWADADPARKAAYGEAIATIARITGENNDAKKAQALLTESVRTIELLDLASSVGRSVISLADQVKDKSQAEQITAAIVEALEPLYKDYDAGVDKDVAKAMLNFYRDNVRPGDAISFGGKDIFSLNIDKYVDNMFKKSIFTSIDKLKSKALDSKAVLSDPAYILSQTSMEALRSLSSAAGNGRSELSAAAKAFTAGQLAWKAGEATYPDANLTCRLTYGTVKSYDPKDGVTYKYYTTLKGVMEKEDPDNYEFRVPAKLKEIYEKGDYGRYANADGELVTDFLTNLDITGGNSGSPVLDADGCLIGLAFDGNWEAMSGDVIFEPELQRCICVDIRYVLLMMDKFGGAGYLLDEMNIVE